MTTKAECNFRKNLKYVTCISTVFLNIVRKVSYLAQDVIVSEIFCQCPKFSPPTYGLFSIQSKILDIYGDARNAFCQIWIKSVKWFWRSRKMFLPYMIIAAILNFGSWPFKRLWYNYQRNAIWEIWLKLLPHFRGNFIWNFYEWLPWQDIVFNNPTWYQILSS